jgi:hypothetical protein
LINDFLELMGGEIGLLNRKGCEKYVSLGPIQWNCRSS